MKVNLIKNLEKKLRRKRKRLKMFRRRVILRFKKIVRIQRDSNNSSSRRKKAKLLLKIKRIEE